MCGIAGLVHLDRSPVDPEDVRRMCETLVHRGPDDEGIVQPVPWVGLGHRRLSIIDVEGGHQPLSNEDRSVWITFNGEIFNYRELARELALRGHSFATRSDTEVIVHLYEEEGPDCVERLNGQFAFAIWDGEKLFCARDPLGIKPFYFYRDRRQMAFASEPRALLALPDFEPEIDLNAIHLYMRYRYIPAPLTAWRGVRKLRPGEWMTLDREGRMVERRYWRMDPAACEDLSDLETAREEVRAELAAAVRRQMVADVPVGAFLSGGLDSSSIAALMMEACGSPVHTFSIGFEERAYDESRHASAVASHLGTDHHVEIFRPEAARGVLQSVLDHLDEPFSDTAILPTYAVARLARSRVKVVQSGDGGDELFAGYGRYFRALQVLAVPPAVRPFWRILRHLREPPRDPARWRYPDTPFVESLYHRFLARQTQGELSRLYGPALRPLVRAGGVDPLADVVASVRGLPPLSRVLAIDLHSILSEYHLVKVDRASMQNSLEVRVPFLDLGFVRLAFRLDAALKLHGGRSKGVLREAMRGSLPETTLDRPKQGFGPPLKHWFAHGLADLARERLDGARSVEEGLLSRRAVENLVTPVRGKTEGSLLWRVLVLESWLRRRRATSRQPPASSLQPEGPARTDLRAGGS